MLKVLQHLLTTTLYNRHIRQLAPLTYDTTFISIKYYTCMGFSFSSSPEKLALAIKKKHPVSDYCALRFSTWTAFPMSPVLRKPTLQLIHRVMRVSSNHKQRRFCFTVYIVESMYCTCLLCECSFHSAKCFLPDPWLLNPLQLYVILSINGS